MEFHQIITDGGAGDLICELVAVIWNVKHHPHVHFHIWVPDYLLDFAKHVLPGQTVRPFSKAKSKFRHDIQGMTTEWCTNHTAMRTHPVDYGFHMLSDRHIYDLNEKNYPRVDMTRITPHFDLPERYIVIQGTAAEPVKTMPVPTLEAVAKYAIGKDYTPVYLGKEESHTGFKDMKAKASIIQADFSNGINLINKTTVLEAAGIIAGAKAFVGMDSGLVHIAGCTDTPIIAGYTLADPVHLAPIRHGSQTYEFYPVEPGKDIPNRYYQTWYSGFMKGDFREFPGWPAVVADMTPDKFLSKLALVLK
jgi:hypothetical protein